MHLILFLFCAVFALIITYKVYGSALSTRQLFYITVLFVIANKLRPILQPFPLNSDEAYLMVSSLVLKVKDSVLWRSVDFGSVGPIQAIPFYVANLFPHEYRFNILHLFLAIAAVIISTLYFKTFWQNSDISSRKFGLIYLLFLFVYFLGNYSGFNHFSNEICSVVLLSIAHYAIMRENFEPKNWQILTFSFILILVPLAKQQAGPLALLMLFAISIKYNIWKNLETLSAYFVGIIIPVTILMGYLWCFGQFNNFWFYFIKVPLSFGVELSITKKIYHSFIFNYGSGQPIKQLYFLTTCLFVYLIINKRMFTFRNIYLLFLSVVTIYCIAKTGLSHDHYFWYTLFTFPYIFTEVILNLGTKLWIKPISLLRILVPLLVIMNLIFYWRSFYNIFRKPTNNHTQISEIGQNLIALKKQLKTQNPTMVVFAWQPYLHFETQIIQGTHHNIPLGLISADKNEQLLDLYLDDLKKNKPEFFVIRQKCTGRKFDKYFCLDSVQNNIPQLYYQIKSNYFVADTSNNWIIFLHNSQEKHVKVKYNISPLEK